MSTSLPFLFELGVEEIPHWMIEPALADLDRLFQQFLSQHSFPSSAVRYDGTPRRLVLRTELPERQEDRADGINMHQRIQRDAALQARGVIAALPRRPRVAKFVKGQQAHQHQILNQPVGNVGIHRHNLAAAPAAVETEPK